jgi:FkbM family methyltransferase
MSLLTGLLKLYYRSGLRGSYRLTDILSHRIDSLKCVPIKTESGILYADLRNNSSRSLLANPKSNSGEDKIMRRFVRPGDTVFDIGAHLGFYTLILSELAGGSGKVYAFEPNSELLPSLKKTLAPLSNVQLLRIALSDRKGMTDLFVPEDASMASLTDWTHGTAGNVHQVACEMQRLDDLVESGQLPEPDFIKCDVEGAELSVFNGGIKTLDSTESPVIMFEVNAKAAAAFGRDTAAYFDFLEALAKPGYKFFEVAADGITELGSKNLVFTNVIAVPKTKIDLCRDILR